MQHYLIIIIMSCLRWHSATTPFLNFSNVVFARALTEMCTARQITCGCTAQTCFSLPVAPQMFSCRGGGLSRAQSVGRPPRQCVTTRESFIRVDVVFLKVQAIECLPLFQPLYLMNARESCNTNQFIETFDPLQTDGQ